MVTVQDRLDIIEAKEDFVNNSLHVTERDNTGSTYVWLESSAGTIAYTHKRFFGYIWDNTKSYEQQVVIQDYDVRDSPVASDDTPYVRVTEKTVGKMMQIYGFEFVATASDTTDFQMKWSNDIEFVGAVAKSEGAHTGDIVNMQIVDVDNILGYGSDFIITEFGKNVPGKIIEAKCISDTTTAATILAGLYVRIQYINIHTTEDVDMHGTLRYYH